ncbi:hypothetical protein JCM10207_004176 [Rhodosporidiobolus poonsookiae]
MALTDRIGAHGHYWILPLAAFVCWMGTLLGLLLWWAVTDDAERYQIDLATIVYVSNIGAEHQWLFILGTSLTAFFYTLSLGVERWLRHLRRLPGALRKRDRNADIVCVVFGILGALALIILACFNCNAFPNVHWSFTAIFVVCIAISALAQTLELHWLRQDHVERKHLKRNAIIKWLIVAFAICGAIAFAGTYATCAGSADDVPLSSRCDTIKSVAAVLEWVIALTYGVYLFSLILDLWPAHKTVGHTFEPRLIQEDKANTLHAHKDATLPGAPGGITVNGSSPALTDIESGIARPSMASEGQYGTYANPVAANEGLTEPEMAHTGGHGPVSRTAY